MCRSLLQYCSILVAVTAMGCVRSTTEMLSTWGSDRQERIMAVRTRPKARPQQ